MAADKSDNKINIAIFNKFDRNGDGLVDKNEIIEFLTTTTDLSAKDAEKKAEEKIKEMDMDDDGKISFSEVQSYWVKSGWLPRQSKIREYFIKFCKNLDLKYWDPIVVDFYDYIRHEAVVRQGVEKMITDAINEHGKDTPIQSVAQMCAALNKIIKLTPQYSNPETDDDPLIGVPIAALFSDVATNWSGHQMFLNPQFNAHLKTIVNAWMNYLDSKESFSINNNGNWLTDEAKKSYDFENYETELKETPYWTSWNRFFTRNLKANVRPNYGENDDSVIQLTCDSAQVRYRHSIDHEDIFWLKDMPYSLLDIFGKKHAKFGHNFVGGSIFHSYLNPFNYHQYCCPVDGVVVERDVLEGAYFAQLVWQHNIDDAGAGTMSLPWLLHVNARGIFIIDTKGYADIGLTCIVAIGMGEVSSVVFYPQVGDEVKKGEPFGAFQFGGSSIVVVNEDLSKYGKKLVYHSKFKEQPKESDHIECVVGEVMGNIQSIK